jgi:RND family efflux transporter MFP subunit
MTKTMLALAAIAALIDTAVWAQTGFATGEFAQLAIHPRREAPASVVSLNETRLSAEVTARVESIAVEVGETIPKGAVVARLDDRDVQLALERAQANLDSAQARLALAESQLTRARELRTKNFVSDEALKQRETEVEVVRAELALARNELATARRSLDKTVLRAPFRAVVRQRLGQVGELASPGTPIVTLVDLSRIEVSARLQAIDAEFIRQAIDIRFEALGRRYPVRLMRLSPVLERESRQIEARLALGNPAPPPGADGRIAWADPREHLPADLLVRRDGQLGVFIEDAGKARFLALPHAQEGRPAPVDLSPGSRVVTEGRFGLRDGQALR